LSRLYRPSRDDEGICLERSLLAYRFLSGAGANPRLVVGIQPGDTSGTGSSLIGHAWIVVDGEPLFESPASLSEYTSFFSFGRAGALDAPIPDGAPALEAATC
jgi:hypothetical protein